MTAVFYVGDAIEVMSKLPEKSVDLVLTSPPFLALRSYLPADHPDKAKEGGSQSTPGEFIDWLLDVVEACDRVLTPHGSLCIELGDTYAGSGGAGGDYDPGGFRDGQPGFRGSGQTPAGRAIDTNEKYERVRGEGYRQGLPNLNHKKQGGGTGWPLAKSLSLIPESFRWAMVYGRNPHTGRRTEPWRLRNVVRWVRPNPPVGALGDKFRPATSELMVFCKSAKRYFDLDAVREVNHPERVHEGASPFTSRIGGSPKGVGTDSDPDYRPSRDDRPWNPAGAPPLDWWNIPPGGYEGAHYAVWPPELCVKPVKAMCPEKVCRVCGEPSRRIAETTNAFGSAVGRASWMNGTEGIGAGHVGALTVQANSKAVPDVAKRVTLGWTDCGHGDWRPGLVLDPFAGSGTTLAVATGHGRDAIGIDLDARNFDLALERVGPFILERAG